jgi:hypothetical protein
MIIIDPGLIMMCIGLVMLIVVAIMFWWGDF